MQISPQCVVALTWVLKDTLGEELDVLDEPVEFLVGGDDLLARIEEVLQGHQAGDTVEVALEPQQAFGDYNENLVFLEARQLFPAELEEGMCFERSALPAGCSADLPAEGLFTVTDLYPDHVVLDGNHPLAGVGLRLRMRIAAVREATEEEVGRGSAGSGFFKVPASAPPDSGLLH